MNKLSKGINVVEASGLDPHLCAPLPAALSHQVRVESGRSVRCGRDIRITSVPLIACSHQR